ncbi:MAG: response regulator [Deltaproteobacteria bacterium]|nr:response regulator [Deltaproteobacteria bacterium]
MMRIMVIDDELMIREVLFEYFTGLGHHVVTADDGCRALSLYGRLHAEGEKIDLVMTDKNMPELDGISFMRQIRDKHQYHGPAILMTADRNEEDKKNFLCLGGKMGYLEKPFSLSRLGGLLDEVSPANDRLDRLSHGATGSGGSDPV